MHLHKSREYCTSDIVFFIVSGILLTLFFLIVLYPCIFVVASSFSSGSAVQSGKVVLWPVDFSLKGYEMVFHTKTVWIGFRNSLFYTVAGTCINLAITMMCAYALSRNDLPGRTFFSLLFTFTMFFAGGLIPNYLLLQKLGMINTVWAIILPGAMSTYNMIIARTFIATSIPKDLLEAAQLDGCSDFRYFISIVIPLSKSIIAVLVLFYGVSHWNSYFNALIYLYDRDLYPLTLFLREILALGNVDPTSVSDPDLAAQLEEYASVLKYALIVVTMIPVLIIYPFVQKHFVKGVMIGSVKG